MILELALNIFTIVLQFIRETGYLGIFIGMTLESSFIPFPSEIILVPAGVLLYKGEMNFILILIASLMGSLLGATINYLLALFIGRGLVELILEKHGKFVLLNKNSLKKTDLFFNKHGEITTLIGRLIPVIRQLISLPAGFARMNFKKFLIFTSLGAGLWSIILIYTGYFFGAHSSTIIENFNGILLIGVLISLIYLFIRRKHNFIIKRFLN